ENEGWFKYLPIEKAHFNKVTNLRKSSKNPAMKAKVEKMIAQEEASLKSTQQQLISEYPDTFFSKVMTWKQTKWQTDKSRYWDDIDFTDESIIRSPIINDRIQDYMIRHSGGTETGFLNAIDLLHQKSSVDPTVNAYTLLTMLEGFYSSKKEDMCLYIMDNYIYGENCGEGDAGKMLQDRALGVKNLRVGGMPPNFVIPTHTGGSLDLMNEVAKHDYTLLFFWSSWCHKCEQETPEYKKLYDQYKGKGFQVVGISVDMSQQAWIKAIEEKGTTWPNVSMLNGWNSPVAEGYRVHETPTLFLLNKNKEIVLKPERWFEVRDYLAKNLK
ncbi:MAG: TlpA family protein disulfide reductase, partial [Flavobacteriales bacterium]|nr:TlpA family protein disulfide reductase [Flavobacteriales bacterium]